MPRIFLIGARASGKTSAGRALARRLDLPFHDLDHCLCQFHQKTVAEIVASGGWSEFRRLETENLRRVIAANAENAVIATGGGIVLAAENRELMRASGLVFWLNAPASALEARLAANALNAQRPSLTGADAIAELRAVLAEREPLYAACAHHIVDAGADIDRICAAISAIYKAA